MRSTAWSHCSTYQVAVSAAWPAVQLSACSEGAASSSQHRGLCRTVALPWAEAQRLLSDGQLLELLVGTSPSSRSHRRLHGLAHSCMHLLLIHFLVSDVLMWLRADRGHCLRYISGGGPPGWDRVRMRGVLQLSKWKGLLYDSKPSYREINSVIFAHSCRHSRGGGEETRHQELCTSRSY